MQKNAEKNCALLWQEGAPVPLAKGSGTRAPHPRKLRAAGRPGQAAGHRSCHFSLMLAGTSLGPFNTRYRACPFLKDPVTLLICPMCPTCPFT